MVKLPISSSVIWGMLPKISAVYVETPKTVEQPGTVYARTTAARQQEAMAFLDKNLFTTPVWLLNQPILDNIGQSSVDVINKVQAPALSRLISASTLTKLIAAEAADGTAAYKITDLFTDIQGSVFSELKAGASIDVYRRNLQKAYVEKLIALVKPAAPAQTLAISGGSLRSVPSGTSQNDVISVVKPSCVN